MKISAPILLAAALTIPALLCQGQTSPPPGMPASTAARILEQATWGPTPASVSELQTKGFDKWFADQIAAPATSYSDLPLLGSDGKAFGNLHSTQTSFYENGLYNPDQLRQRVAFALSEIWVVSRLGAVGYAAAFPPLLNIFQKDAFAPYPKLMKDVTLNWAMGGYLDMLNNHKSTATTSANENYGRELMQLFTIGTTNLDLSGNVVSNSNGPIPTYTGATVTGMTAALTGWTTAAARSTGQSPNVYDPMVPNEGQHDVKAKTLSFTYPDGTVHTTTLPASQMAATDLDSALAVLAKHPSLAPFVVKQLIQHLVTSNPSGAYVNRVTTVFNDTSGNLQAVVKAILIDQEARAGDSGLSGDTATFGHLREPVLMLLNLLRGMNGNVSDSSTVNNYGSGMGQNLLYEPSVFSYFSPAYRANTGLLAPEFQIHSTQSSVTRSNYIYSLIYNGHLDAGTTIDITEFVTAAATPANLKTLINTRFFHGSMSAGVQSAIDTALTGLTANADKAKAALYVALTSAEYQVIH